MYNDANVKICIIGPTWPFRGGIAHYTTLLVKHLREAGHHVRFISYLKQYPKWLYPGNTAMDPSPDSSVLKIECDRVLTPLGPLTWWKAYQIIKEEQPDVLILQWWTPFFSPMLFMLTRLLRRSTVTYINVGLYTPGMDGGVCGEGGKKRGRRTCPTRRTLETGGEPCRPRTGAGLGSPGMTFRSTSRASMMPI